jgi:hypothetical protein
MVTATPRRKNVCRVVKASKQNDAYELERTPKIRMQDWYLRRCNA